MPCYGKRIIYLSYQIAGRYGEKMPQIRRLISAMFAISGSLIAILSNHWPVLPKNAADSYRLICESVAI